MNTEPLWLTDGELEGQMPFEAGAGFTPITTRELANRKMAAPLKPTKPQQPANFGLFGDEHNQKELF